MAPPRQDLFDVNMVLGSESESSPMNSSPLFFFFLVIFKIRFLNILFFRATCVSLSPETPSAALILDVPSGGSPHQLPQDPLPSADVVTGVTLKAPQVGLPECVVSTPVLKVWP